MKNRKIETGGGIEPARRNDNSQNERRRLQYVYHCGRFRMRDGLIQVRMSDEPVVYLGSEWACKNQLHGPLATCTRRREIRIGLSVKFHTIGLGWSLLGSWGAACFSLIGH